MNKTLQTTMTKDKMHTSSYAHTHTNHSTSGGPSLPCVIPCSTQAVLCFTAGQTKGMCFKAAVYMHTDKRHFYRSSCSS